MSAPTVTCTGVRTDPQTGERRACHDTVYRCMRCHNVGCNKPGREQCTHQGFAAVRCQKCHVVGEVDLPPPAP